MRQEGVGSIRTLVLATALAAAAVTPARARGGQADQAGEEPRPPERTSAFGTAVQRWFDLQTASFMARYRRIETGSGIVSHSHLQDSILLEGRLKADAEGRYSVNFGAATGSSFTGGWNNTGLGIGGDLDTEMSLKQLFIAAAPVDGLRISYGGLGLLRGQSTEITSYDNDGYIVGERVTLRRPARLFLDEISTTFGYLGDLGTPSVFDRFRRLDRVNYRHVLAGKQVAPWLATSVDYTRLAGVGTLRNAVTVRTPRARVVDFVRYEWYRRFGRAGAFGYSGYGEKAIGRRVSVGAGFADIDPAYGGLNADRFDQGRRVFAGATLRLARDLTLTAFLTQAVQNRHALPNLFRADVAIAYNALGPMQRAGLFR